jgi:hypothetical protein
VSWNVWMEDVVGASFHTCIYTCMHDCYSAVQCNAVLGLGHNSTHSIIHT